MLTCPGLLMPAMSVHRSMTELLYFILSSVMHLRAGPDTELASMLAMGLQSLVGEIQWLLAMLRSTQGANSPHIQVRARVSVSGGSMRPGDIMGPHIHSQPTVKASLLLTSLLWCLEYGLACVAPPPPPHAHRHIALLPFLTGLPCLLPFRPSSLHPQSETPVESTRPPPAPDSSRPSRFPDLLIRLPGPCPYLGRPCAYGESCGEVALSDCHGPLQVLVSLIRAMHGERLVRRATEEHIKSMASAAESSNLRTKQMHSRYEDLLEKLANKDKAMVVLKGDLGEAQDEVRMLRERVQTLEEEVKTLEGNMTLAEHRALATAQVHH